MYNVHDGRIMTWSLEAHVADHCNLACRQCCTLSPHLKPRFTDPADLQRVLGSLSAALRPDVFKVTGGEPLLHPDMEGILTAARRSGIARQIQVTTNGHLLPRAGAGFWSSIDRLTISSYPDPPLPPEAIATARRECSARGIILTIKEIDAFARMTPEKPLESAGEIRSIFDSCWLKHRCHLVHEGRFYRCTRPPHLQQYLQRPASSEDLSMADGIELSGPNLGRRILDHLESHSPLESCRFCLGASGEYEPHAQNGADAANTPTRSARLSKNRVPSSIRREQRIADEVEPEIHPPE